MNFWVVYWAIGLLLLVVAIKFELMEDLDGDFNPAHDAGDLMMLLAVAWSWPFVLTSLVCVMFTHSDKE